MFDCVNFIRVYELSEKNKTKRLSSFWGKLTCYARHTLDPHTHM